MKTAKSVEIIVMLTDKATSPLAKYTITLDAVPPGQLDTIIKPKAISSGNPNIEAIVKPHAGITRNCAPTPIKMVRGLRSTREKSSAFKVIPIPSMIIAKPNAMVSLPNQRKTSGCDRETPPTIKERKGKNLTNSLEMLLNIGQ